MILVFGCGLTGGSVTRFLAKQHLAFHLADTRTHPPLQKNHPELCTTTCYFGNEEDINLANYTSIILSPGIPLFHPLIIKAHARGITVLSDIDLCYLYYPEKTYIGITGTNGKSTTTDLLTHIFTHSKISAVACGNIGVPILEVVESHEVCVIELSSYQLDITHYMHLQYAVVLNITPDHLDRYADFYNYIYSKLHIYDLCHTAIINPKNDYTSHISGVSFVPQQVASPYLIGAHNQENISAALTIAYEYGIDREDITTAIAMYKGLPHRIEFVTTINGIDFYNDSKATNAQATITAIAAMKEKYQNITLILGGAPKNEDYAPLFTCINQRVSQVILLGESTTLFYPHLNCAKHCVANMQAAVRYAKQHANEVVLFSAACASFDAYNNFVERGNNFKQIVINQ